MDFLSHGKLQEIKALHGFRTCQAQVHLSAIAGGVLKGNMDGQPFFCEIIEILVVNLAPKGCGDPRAIPDLQRKCQLPDDPQELFLLLACLSDVLTPNECFFSLFKGEHDPVPASWDSCAAGGREQCIQPSSHGCQGKGMTW